MKLHESNRDLDMSRMRAVDWGKKVKFAQALGSDLGAAVNTDVGGPQPEWGPLIAKVLTLGSALACKNRE